MRVLRFFALLIAASLSLPASAAVFPYKLTTATGTNNIQDWSPIGGCQLEDPQNPGFGGCRSFEGTLCSADPNGQCIVERVPAGRCSRVDFSTPGADLCLWPNGAGFCVADPNRGCLSDGDCPGADTCDLSFDDPNCVCQGSDPNAPQFETSVCGGREGVCSDGDGTDFEFRGSSSLCVHLRFGLVESFTNCGREAQRTRSGPRDNGRENNALTVVPQRVPGSGQNFGAIVDNDTTYAIDFEPPDVHGVRRFSLLNSSYWADPDWNDKEITGSLINSNGPVTYKCDIPIAWETQQPVEGFCTLNPGTFCVEDGDCPGGDTCNPATFRYCHETVADSPGWMWTQDVDPNAPDTCPPKCGANYNHDAFEMEELIRVSELDPEAGAQLVLDSMVGRSAGEGDMILVDKIFSLTWVDLDKRCFIGGNPNRANPLDSKIGRCSDSEASCDPATEPAGGGVDCPLGESCQYCQGTFDAATNPKALPIGYDDRAIPALGIEGRVGLINSVANELEVPLFIITTTGFSGTQFKDNSCGIGDDVCLLGEVSGGHFGIGDPIAGDGVCIVTTQSFDAQANPPPSCTTQTDCDTAAPGTTCVPLSRVFQHGVDVLPAFGTTCCQTGSDIPVVAADPGTEVTPLRTTGDWGVGPNGIPGCPGDSSNNKSPPGSSDVDPTPCTDPLGFDTDNFGVDLNTGADDPKILRNITNDPNAAPVHVVQPLFKTPNPLAAAPTFSGGYAGVVRDLDVQGFDNTDVLFKGKLVWCPIDPDTGEEQCVFPGGIVDDDGDGIDDGVDNCLGVFNPTQADRGGLNTDTPNGVGDACECGDVTNNGQVQINDATIIKRAILDLGPGIAAPGLCNVIGTSDTTLVNPARGLTADCLINDATVTKRAILGLGPGIGSDCGQPEP